MSRDHLNRRPIVRRGPVTCQLVDENIIYGAFVVDDTARVGRTGQGDLPSLYFRPYDHHSVSVSNIADIGCIAHRTGLAEARFDETLREMGDGICSCG